jgi:hypothetical protein
MDKMDIILDRIDEMDNKLNLIINLNKALLAEPLKLEQLLVKSTINPHCDVKFTQCYSIELTYKDNIKLKSYIPVKIEVEALSSIKLISVEGKDIKLIMDNDKIIYISDFEIEVISESGLYAILDKKTRCYYEIMILNLT